MIREGNNKGNARIYKIEPSESQNEVMAQVKRHIESFREQYYPPSHTPSGEGMEVPFEDSVSPVISIVGGRGTGKTTVLHWVLRRLEDEPVKNGYNIVLPHVNVEYLSNIDNAVGWILSSFRDKVNELEERSRKRGPADPEEKTLQEKYDRLLHKAYAYSPLLGEVLKRKEEFDDLSFEIGSILKDHRVLRYELNDFLDHFLASSQVALGALRTLVLIGIDDADICPEMVEKVLKAIRFLGCDPRVAFILCWDHDTMQTALMVNTLSSLKIEDPNLLPQIVSGIRYHSKESPLQSLVVEKMNKLLPVRFRCYLKGCPTRDRTTFRPNIGEKETLIDLLRKVKLITDDGEETKPQSLGDFFDLSWAFEKRAFREDYSSPYVSCLLSRPRHLLALYALLQSHVKRPSGEKETPRSLLFDFLYRFWRISIENEEHAQWEPPLSNTVVWFREREAYQFDFSDIASGFVVRRSALTATFLHCHPVDRLQLYWTHPRKDLPPILEPLPRSAIMLLSLFHDLTRIHGFPVDGTVYRGFSHDVICIRPDGDPKVSWPLPPFWDMALEYFLFEAGWNNSLSYLRRSDGKAKTLLDVYLALVFSISLFRRIPSFDEDRTPKGQVKELLGKLSGSQEKRMAGLRLWLGTFLACLEETDKSPKKELLRRLASLAVMLVIDEDDKKVGKDKWKELKKEREYRLS